MDKKQSLTIVIAYLSIMLAIIIFLSINLIVYPLGAFENFRLLFSCSLIGGVGGVLYCFRGVYLNHSVKDQWSDKWIPWYLIRPIVSLICGGVSYLFLKASLLVLEAQKEGDASNLGFYTLAFIAGMNVDRFIEKIEDLAHATWGIGRSRSTTTKDN